MKNVLVTSDYFEDAPYILIQNTEDFFEYAKRLDKGIDETIWKAMKSKVSPDRLNHLVNKEKMGDQILAQTYARATVEGGSPLLMMGDAVTDKLQTISKMLRDHGAVLINKNGGFCFPQDNWIITEVDDVPPELNIVLAKNPSFINLENDPEIEDRTKEWFKENNYELSYIRNLRDYSKDNLIKIFKDFKCSGGKGIYVYTTAMDYIQLQDYCHALMNSGLKEAVFEWSAGQPSKLVCGIIRELAYADIEVEIVE